MIADPGVFVFHTVIAGAPASFDDGVSRALIEAALDNDFLFESSFDWDFTALLTVLVSSP